MEYQEILDRLESQADPDAVAGRERFGIRARRSFGIRMPVLRQLAKEIGKDHSLAQQLWSSGIYECRLLASMVDDPRQVTEEQMESWVAEFDSWAVCDAHCGNLFDRTEFAYRKAVEWSSRPEEYVKRAAFALMASLAVHDKRVSDRRFVEFLPIIVRESTDDRNLVRKAVNWALRQIGKRSLRLNGEAVRAAEEIRRIGSRSGRWIASDALRELTGKQIQGRLRKRGGGRGQVCGE